MTVNDLDSAPCGFLVFSDDGKIVAINQTLLHQLAYEQKNELVGKSVENIFTIAGRIFYQTHFFPLIKMHGHAEEIFFILRGKKEVEFPVICNAVRKESNGIQEYHCILFQAVQRGKYEQQLLQAKQKAEQALLENAELAATKDAAEKNVIELDRRLSQLINMNDDVAQFSKIISHDMQETVRKIGLFADKLAFENAAVLGDSIIRDLNRINKECRRMRALTVQLEKFISLNSVPELFVEVDLNEFFDHVKGFEIIKEQLPVIKGNPTELAVLFSQILDNAFQYRSSERPLIVTVEATMIQQNSFKEIKGKYRYIDFIQLTITDNGAGFAISNPDELFTIRRKDSGDLLHLSFGLAFAKKIVDNHFGFISIRSVPGNGTSVFIHLPV